MRMAQTAMAPSMAIMYRGMPILPVTHIPTKTRAMTTTDAICCHRGADFFSSELKMLLSSVVLQSGSFFQP